MRNNNDDRNRPKRKTIREFGVVYRDSHSLVYGWIERPISLIDWDEVYEKMNKKKERKDDGTK